MRLKKELAGLESKQKQWVTTMGDCCQTQCESLRKQVNVYTSTFSDSLRVVAFNGRRSAVAKPPLSHLTEAHRSLVDDNQVQSSRKGARFQTRNLQVDQQTDDGEALSEET